jgi:hypothetical protein
MSDATLLQPSLAALRKLFRASADALLANRPLREAATPGSAPGATMSEGELAALRKVGLATTRWAGDDANDPLTRTIVDYMALIETSCTTARAAAMLGVDSSRIRQRLRERTLFGIEYEGEWRLPRFQFERKKALPGLNLVLPALPADINPLDAAAWFLEPNVDLGMADAPISPRAWLLRGRSPGAVAALARQL